jgi:hypothetical protein
VKKAMEEGENMNRYRIRYKDPDPGCPIFSTIIRAYDEAHAEEKFFDTNDTDWEIVSIERVKE